MTVVGRWVAQAIRVAPLAAHLAALLATVASTPASAGELWRGSAGSAECRLELVNRLGGVLITTSSLEESSLIVSGGPELMIEASALAERSALVVAWNGPPDDAASDVEVSVPPGCDVTVRTTDGAVSLDVGPQAFSAAVETVTGDITAWVDPDTNATIVFATSGEITTDFKVDIAFRYHAEPAKHGHVTLQAGSPSEHGLNSVSLHSRRGAVRLLRPTPNHRVHRPDLPHGDPEHR